MKRVLLCAVLAGACSSRGGTSFGDPDASVSGDTGGGTDRGVTPSDVPTKGTDVPTEFDAGFPADVPTEFDAGFPEDIPVTKDVPPPPMDLGPRCVSDRDCSASGLVCDLDRGNCVECVRAADCLVAGQTCSSNRCVAGFDAGTPTDRGFPVDRGTPTDTGVSQDAGPGATLMTGLGGPNGFGPLTNCLGQTDDGSYVAGGADGGAGSAISMGSAFGAGLLMRGQRYPTFYLNANGNISFGGPLAGYTPAPFPRALSTSPLPIIAPWFADADTRGGVQPGTNHVCFLSGTDRFVATWYRVGYYNAHTDRLNSFQVIVTPVGSAGDFDVEFRYAACQWTTGDASGGTGGLGGTPAQAGIDLGDGVNSFTLPGSLTSAVTNLCGTSNVGIPGVWRVQVRSGTPRSPG
jgi:hypothetical protein